MTDQAAIAERLGHYGRVARAYAETAVADKAGKRHSKWIRLAAQRHLDDLAKVDDADFAYRFDDAKAFKACAFIELMPHVKGQWAAQGKRLRLSPWQVFITASIFGWVRKSDGLRRYRRALVLVPRKNGKSALAAAIGLYMAFGDGEFGAEVYSGATSERQAMEVFAPALEMAKRTPDLMSRYGLIPAVKRIVSPESNSKFEPLIAKPGDGSSPHCAIIDEYHEHTDDSMVSTMRTGMGARSEPLMLQITTAGDNVSGPCHAAMLDAQRLLEGVQTDDALFAALYGLDEGDDWTTDDALLKANPNANMSVPLEFLQAERDQALQTARLQGQFRTKHLNQWIGARSAFFNMQNWRKCGHDDLSIEQFEGSPCYIGLDLGSVSDLSATALLFPRENGRYAVFCRFYLPESALGGVNRERYAEFHRSGRLTVAGDSMTDQSRIEDDILLDMERFRVQQLAFDPWQATNLIARLEAAGAPAMAFHKTTKNVSAPMKTLAGLIDDGRIQHDQCPVTSWNFGNVVTYEDAAGNVRANKESREKKIDACDAVIAALAVQLADEAASIGSGDIWFATV